MHKMTTEKYDLIVIGTGSGGLSVGLSMHELGFKVLFVEKSTSFIGGECLNTGCVPSKALIHVAKILHQSSKAGNYGMQVSGKPDFERVKAYIKERQDQIRAHENADYFRQKGISIVEGIARFASKRSIEVNGKEYFAKNIIMATGSKPKKLKIEGVEKVAYYDNENIFDLDVLPERLLVVGAGPVGIELAQAFQRLGAEVTVINRHKTILTREDREITEVLFQKLKEDGIKFYNEAEVKFFADKNTAVIKNAENKEEKISFDIVLVAIGREILLDELNLEKADIKTDQGKLIVDNYLRTTNKNVQVAGDVAGEMKFSHAAELHASVIVYNLLSPFKKKLNYDTFSWVTFTDPEVATFGLDEKTLTDRGIAYEKFIYDFKEDDRAIIDEYSYGKMVLFLKKGMIKKRNMKILGGSMVAPNAGGTIQELILAASTDIGILDIFNKTYSYPVSERVNKMAVIQKYTKELTPFVKRVLRRIYRLW